MFFIPADVWMLSCMTFVFCSLLELACVGFLSRDTSGVAAHSPKKPKKKKKKGFHSGRTSPGVVSDKLLDVPQPAYQSSNALQTAYQMSTPAYQTLNQNVLQPTQQGQGQANVKQRLSACNNVNYSKSGGSPLLPLRQIDDHYDYRPPGFGLGLNNSLAKFILSSGPSHSCSCQNSFGYQNLPDNQALGSYHERMSQHSQTQKEKDKIHFAKLEKLALNIDRMSCIVFPSLFALFNIGYWWYYLGG